MSIVFHVWLERFSWRQTIPYRNGSHQW